MNFTEGSQADVTSTVLCNDVIMTENCLCFLTGSHIHVNV